MNVVDYINEFDRLHSRIVEKQMKLPDGVLAYRLLKSAHLSSERQILCRATITALTYENMKKQIKAILNFTTSDDSCGKIKVEPTFSSFEDPSGIVFQVFKFQTTTRKISYFWECSISLCSSSI